MSAMKPMQSSSRESFAYWGDREGWLQVIGQHRDSDALARSNFRVALRLLGGEDDAAGVAVERASHCAVGWVETILVRPDADAMVREAERIRARIEDYPVLSDDDYSELQYTEAADYWERMSVRDRAEVIQEHGRGVSVFAARRAEMPQDDDGQIYEYLTREA